MSGECGMSVNMGVNCEVCRLCGHWYVNAGERGNVCECVGGGVGMCVCTLVGVC